MITMEEIIKYPLSTEKAIRLMESENQLVFVVAKKANKQELKLAIEDLFKIKVLRVNTHVDRNGHKRAYVKLHADNPAIDVATQLGLM